MIRSKCIRRCLPVLALLRLFAVPQHYEAINSKATIFIAEHRIDINFRYGIIKRNNHLRKAHKLLNHQLAICWWLSTIPVK